MLRANRLSLGCYLSKDKYDYGEICGKGAISIPIYLNER